MQVAWTEEIIFTGHDGVQLHFRIELIRPHESQHAFVIRQWRFETFALEPSFPSDKISQVRADHCVVVVDPFLDGEEVIAESASEAMGIIIERLKNQLGG